MTYSTLGVLSFSVSVVIEIESCDENFGLGPVSVTGIGVRKPEIGVRMPRALEKGLKPANGATPIPSPGMPGEDKGKY